jgi:hypothetical protein
MTAKTTKQKAKSRRSSRAKPKRASVALLASTSAVRKAKPSEKGNRAQATVAGSLNPAFAMFEFMGRVTAAYAELPARLVQCRSPMDVWREQARFAQRIMSVSQVTASAPARTASKSIRKAS